MCAVGLVINTVKPRSAIVMDTLKLYGQLYKKNSQLGSHCSIIIIIMSCVGLVIKMSHSVKSHIAAIIVDTDSEIMDTSIIRTVSCGPIAI